MQINNQGYQALFESKDRRKRSPVEIYRLIKQEATANPTKAALTVSKLCRIPQVEIYFEAPFTIEYIQFLMEDAKKEAPHPFEPETLHQMVEFIFKNYSRNEFAQLKIANNLLRFVCAYRFGELYKPEV